MNNKELDLFDNERAIKIFCESKLDVSVIKRVLFFLEKQEMLELSRNIKNSNINVTLKKDEKFIELVNEGILDDDLKRCRMVKKLIPRLRSLKLDTLQTKIFGYNEVEKWED